MQIGSVIGKGGAVINRIRQATGAQIKIHEEEDTKRVSCAVFGADELLSVTGDHSVVGEAVKQLSKQLRSFQVYGKGIDPG